ncbi:MAG: YacL family protein [Oceanicoccus sp.]
MDYEFTLDEYDRPVAIFSSGFEALGRWFTEELNDHEFIHELLSIVEQLEQHRIQRRQLFGSDSHLDIDQDEVTVTATALGSDADEDLPEGTRLYDDESVASCGLQDFKQVLLSWQDFVV